MRKTLPCVLAAAFAALAGCTPFWNRTEPASKRVLGVTDPRIREMTIETAEAEMARPQGGLRLVIDTDRKVYRMDEPIVLDVRLENITGSEPKEEGRDIAIYYEPFAKTPEGEQAEWLFRFVLRSESDGEIVYQSREFEVKEKDRGGYYHYVTLPPQSFVGRKFVSRPARVGNWLKPGRYSFIVDYAVSEDYPYVIVNRQLSQSQVTELGLKLAYVRVWTGRLYSNRVEFRIRGARRFLFF